MTAVTDIWPKHPDTQCFITWSVEPIASKILDINPEQHKSLSVVFLEDGNIGAYPNNRIIFEDPAFWETVTERPDFEALDLESRAEGFDVEELRRKPKPAERLREFQLRFREKAQEMYDELSAAE